MMALDRSPAPEHVWLFMQINNQSMGRGGGMGGVRGIHTKYQGYSPYSFGEKIFKVFPL